MEAPKNQDPEAWARFNELIARELAHKLGLPRLELRRKTYAIQIVEMPDSLKDLILVVRGAASELENGGERENRIAQQLLTALADFAQETGT